MVDQGFHYWSSNAIQSYHELPNTLPKTATATLTSETDSAVEEFLRMDFVRDVSS